MQVILDQEDFGSAAHITDLDKNEKFANPKVSGVNIIRKKKAARHINSYCDEA